MKKYFYSLCIAAVVFSAGNASFGQAKKYPLFEHFSQASCPPCAAQNPYFEAVYEANYSNMHHITYHTSWPGVDPMYDYNTSASAGMVSYYGVSGVPDMFINGTNNNSPANVTQEVVNDLFTESSPIRILVTESTVGTTRNVTVEVQTI